MNILPFGHMSSSSQTATCCVCNVLVLKLDKGNEAIKKGPAHKHMEKLVWIGHVFSDAVALTTSNNLYKYLLWTAHGQSIK